MKRYIVKILRINKLSFLFLAVIFLALFSCERKINWDLKTSSEQFLIVDGLITNEYANQKINLTLSVQNLNDTAKSVSDATITISDGEQTFNFHENTTSGIYLSDSKFSAVVNKTYTLNIKYNNEDYFAEANIYPVSVSDPLPYIQIPDTNLYYIAYDIAEFNPYESAMYEVILDWSDVNGYENLPINETSAKMYYYRLKTIDVNQIFAPDNEIVIFPYGTLMTQRKYSLSPEHEDFIRSVLMESQWHGGNFDIEEGNVYTNLSSGALGFFGASSVISFSTIVQ
ncbi:MAG: DUF4249 domain-containing protein [Bacteroidales bacterium]|nr:DUF4249 domain-containing protein [Bacteroidales bacterium]